MVWIPMKMLVKKHQHGGPYVPWRCVSLPECIFFVKNCKYHFFGNESGMNLRYVRNLDLPLHPGFQSPPRIMTCLCSENSNLNLHLKKRWHPGWGIYIFHRSNLYTFFCNCLGIVALDVDVSKNSGTPKSSILIGFSIIHHPFWGFSHYFWKHPCVFFGACRSMS